MQKPKVEIVRLEDQWRRTLLERHWSKECTWVFDKFIAPSTLRQYNNYIAQFQNFCVSNSLSFPPEQATRSAIIAEFLLFKAKQSERPESMLRSIRAALTHYFDSIDISEPFCLALRHFSTALVKAETTRPAGRTPIMPIKPFTDMFNNWPDNDKLTTSKLRLKAVTLLTISTLARCSDLAPTNTLKRDQIHFNTDGSLTLKMFGIKNDTDRKGFEIRVEKSSIQKCDPVQTLKDYMTRTAKKVVPKAVFVKTNSPNDPISARGIAEILRAAIKEAGLSDVYTPRCFRPSAASAAVKAECNHESIRQLGRWKTREVFYENYVYPLTQTDTTDKILKSELNIY